VSDYTAKHLSEQHVEQLRASGLNDETIEAAGLRTVTDARVIKKLLHWERKQEIGPCLAFPYPTAEGVRGNGYVRLRPDKPRQDKDGKPVKYESPKGVPLHAYFPPVTCPLADYSA
jgi:hypothetical protein